LTFKALPLSSLPFNSLMADRASSADGISTKPNPFDWPLNLSFMMFMLDTWPKDSNADRKSFSVTLYAKFPT